MSSIARKTSKAIAQHNLRFPVGMYGNLYGSVIISALMFLPEDKIRDRAISKVWQKIEKSPEDYIDFFLDDEQFIDKCLALFKLPKPDNWQIAFVQSDFNCLCAPFVDGEVWPLREDGFMGPTLTKGKVYPIDLSREE